MLGAQVDGPQPATFNDLDLDFFPRVVWSPFFAITTDDLQVCSVSTGYGYRASDHALVY